MIRNYTRWTTAEGGILVADLLGIPDQGKVRANPTTGKVSLGDTTYSPDEARLIGVRLVEAAALADDHRAIRAMASETEEKN